MHLLKVTILVLISTIQIYASPEDTGYKIFYHNYRDGSKTEGSEYAMTYYKDIAYLSKNDASIQNFIDYKNEQNTSVLLYNNKLYGTITNFSDLPQPDYTDKTDTIMGYVCNHAEFMYFSNKIEVWYNDQLSIKGSPYSRYLPNPRSLVLKVVINGNYTLLADSISKISSVSDLDYPFDKAEVITKPEFEELKIKSRYNTIEIFDNEIVNFDPDYWKHNEFDSISGVYHYSKGAVILKKIEISDDIKEGALVFINLTCYSRGDAYDRTGTVFLIQEQGDRLNMLNALRDSLSVVPVFTDNKGKSYQGFTLSENYEPPIELMRFFTPFGVRHFNDRREINNYNWTDESVYKQDVTNLIPVNKDHVWVGVFIGNYDRGGHSVSLELNVYPNTDESNTVKYIKPLFSTVNIMEMSGQNYGRLFLHDTLQVGFNLEDSISNLMLLFTTTGHGGWGGGDEFNPRLNEVFIDGELVYSVIPWRTDCATYRLLNPASGNFANGMSSSDYSRSNWCPGTLTPPYMINLSDLLPGNHKIEVVIDQGDDAGGSFNHWSISGVLVGDR